MASSQVSSSTSRTTVRVAVLKPVGRKGVARKARRSGLTASPGLAGWCSASVGWPPRSRATSDRSRVASARLAMAAGPRNGSRAGVGQSSSTASSDATEASPQPASRDGIEAAGAISDTGRMKASSSDVVAPASTELTTPAKITAKPTTAMATAASQALREASVPTQTNTAPTSASATCARTRSPVEPPKSTSNSIAKEPNAAKVARSALSSTVAPRANMAGMTIAVRPARRSAANPRSRSCSRRSKLHRHIIRHPSTAQARGVDGTADPSTFGKIMCVAQAADR